MKRKSSARRFLRLRTSAVLLGAVFVFASSGFAQTAEERLDLDALDRKVELARARLAKFDETATQLAAEIQTLEKRVVLRGRAYYRLSRGTTSSDFFEHAVRLERIRQGLVRDQARLVELGRRRTIEGLERAKLEDRLRPLELEQAAAGRARDALLAETERQRAFSLAFQSASSRPDHTAIYSANSTLEYAGESFETLRGRLPFPLSGRSEVEFVKKPSVSGMGVVFRAASSSPVRSVFAGRVALADEHPDYGKTVVVDHGEGYFTLVAHLGAMDVTQGEEVTAGSRLGTTSGRAGLHEVYLEVRRHQQVLPPGEWFGL